MKNTQLILVGGFLGAGKTTILKQTAARLKKQGKAVGLITNDQATDLVDTTVLQGSGDAVEEVSGSCFCCNFNGFADAIDAVTEAIGDGGVVVAEPVGSCTDLSATIMQPLKDKYAAHVNLAPLTVVADPARLQKILDGTYATASYIMSKQFDESDIILINKIDTLSEASQGDLLRQTAERWPKSKVMLASAKEGEGLAQWLEAVTKAQPVGANLAEVDYDIYADGEAAYGWLNATYTFGESDGGYKAAAANFLQMLGNDLSQAGAAIGHVKFLLQTKDYQYLGNLTGEADTATLSREAAEADAVTLTVNARAEVGLDALQKIVLKAIDKAFDAFTPVDTSIRTLIPGRPNPTYHYDRVI